MFDKEGCGISNNRRRYSCDEACCRKNDKGFETRIIFYFHKDGTIYRNWIWKL
jgi:hypothetical protein